MCLFGWCVFLFIVACQSVCTLNLNKNGAIINWFAWLGRTSGDPASKQHVFIAKVRPSCLDKSTRFKSTKVSDQTGSVICTLLFESDIQEIVSSDNTLLEPIINQCIQSKILSESDVTSTISSVASPSKSPLKKRPKRVSEEPRCKTSLLGGTGEANTCLSNVFEERPTPSNSGILAKASPAVCQDEQPSAHNAFHNLNSKLLNKAEVSNIPNPFFKDHFLYTLNSQMWMLDSISSQENYATKCSNVEGGSAVIEFSSVDAAAAACRIKNFLYEGKIVELTQLKEEVHLSPDVKVYPIKKLFKSGVHGMNAFVQEYLLHRLNDCMHSASMLPQGEEAAISCSDLSDDFVIVKFRNVSDASSACLLHCVEYNGTLLTMEQLLLERQPENTTSDEVCVDQRNRDKPRLGDCHPLTEVEPVGSCMSNYLNSYAGTARFLEQCIAHKEKDQKFKGTKATFEKICAHFREDSICITVEDCQSRMKSLYNQHRTVSRSQWRDQMRFLRQEDGATWPPSSADDLLAPDLGNKMPIRNVNAFKGREKDKDFSWTADNNSAALMLIDILIERKQEYSSVHKDSTFWGSVADVMVRVCNFKVTAEDCKTQAKLLESQYRCYQRMRKRTGSGKCDWPLAEPLEPLLGDSIAVEPQKTYSAGPRNEETINQNLGACEPLRGVGRTRVSPKTLERDARLQKVAAEREKYFAELRALTAELKLVRK